jgi:chromosome segregation ATPase
MLNEELFFDKKDLEIAKLKQSIARFKKLDKNRNQNHKKEISELKIEIGKLKSYIEELESDKDLEKLKTRIKNQREVILSLERKLHCSKLEESRLLELEMLTKDSLSNQIKSLKTRLENLRKNNSELLSLLAKYRNKFGEI